MRLIRHNRNSRFDVRAGGARRPGADFRPGPGEETSGGSQGAGWQGPGSGCERSV